MRVTTSIAWRTVESNSQYVTFENILYGFPDFPIQGGRLMSDSVIAQVTYEKTNGPTKRKLAHIKLIPKVDDRTYPSQSGQIPEPLRNALIRYAELNT